jgi:hypothetical protein
VTNSPAGQGHGANSNNGTKHNSVNCQTQQRSDLFNQTKIWKKGKRKRESEIRKMREQRKRERQRSTKEENNVRLKQVIIKKDEETKRRSKQRNKRFICFKLGLQYSTLVNTYLLIKLLSSIGRSKSRDKSLRVH